MTAPTPRSRVPAREVPEPSDIVDVAIERDAWREVSRHLEIAASTESLYAVLARALPVRWLVLYRWSPSDSRLDLVGHAGELPSRLPWRIGLPTPRARDLRDWAARREVTPFAFRDVTSLSRTVVPEGVGGPSVAAPLIDDDGFAGVLVLGGRLADRIPVLGALVEPFLVALHNDGRLHELARLQEAAEADRTALLQRLGRQDIADTVVGAQDGLRKVIQRVDQVARADVPVLILGETGSGKEVIARQIHTRSGRASGPFLKVNCGAIPPELVDSELFGHEKGAFTGAVASRAGWFERADGGTLFLDEVGDLPPAAQVRLLRVLQDGTFDRVGGTASITVDVRIVTATHRDLPGFVRDGKFREDLWYRIGVFPIVLPPLRERAEDVPMLARHFAEHAGRRLFGLPLVPTEADLALLRAYPWPGNVRELAAVIERAAILGDGDGLQVQAALGVLPGAAAPGATATPAPPPGIVDRAGVEEALRRAHGRIEGPFGAAKILGVNPHTLRSRMRRMGIEWPRFRG
jgi:transcriptional regulator with GAF, ATPase, and Fis domain